MKKTLFTKQVTLITSDLKKRKPLIPLTRRDLKENEPDSQLRSLTPTDPATEERHRIDREMDGVTAIKVWQAQWDSKRFEDWVKKILWMHRKG